MITRNMIKKLSNALTKFRIIMLNGPRQSGKTTVVKTMAKQLDMQYITLDEPTALSLATDDPAGFLDFYAQNPLVIDEIQFAPELIAYIKIKVDNNNATGQFLLTGSADFLQMHKITESLAGRMVRYNLYPIANAELYNKNYNIIDQLFSGEFKSLKNKTTKKQVLQNIIRGGYPEIIAHDEDYRGDWFDSYISARIQKDIQEYKQISLSKLRMIRKLLQLLASFNAQLLNYNTLAKKLQIDNKTVLSYVELLQAMYIIKIIPSYHVNTALRVVKSAKVYFIDTGLASYLLNMNTENLFIHKDGKYGGLIENFVYCELLKEATYAQNSIEFHHFRDLRKKEVDLVLENRDGNIIGIEVKGKSTIKSKDLKGMVKLAETTKDKFSTGIVFYGGDEIQPISVDGHLFYCLPLGLLS